MRNGSVELPSPLFRTITDLETNTSSYATFPANSYSDSISSSGYTGPRIKPLQPHAFNYNIRAINGKMDAVEYLHRPRFTEKRTTWAGGGVNGFPTINVQEGDLYNELLEKLTEKVRGSIDLSIDIAQAGQTARMLKGSASVTNLARLLQKKSGLLKIPASLWLEYTYGWEPLLSTVYDAAMKSTQVVINKTRRIKVSRNMKTTNPPIYFLDSMGRGHTINAPGDHKIGYTMIVNMKTHTQMQPSQWTSLNPASIAWELVPYSFVVDWFYDVGSFLRNIETSYLYSNDFINGYVSRIEACDLSLNDRQVQISSDKMIESFFTFTGAYRSRKFSRTLLTGYPSPRKPTFKVDLGSSKLLSAASLLAVLLK